jgi:tRNA A-37 threonylcarbamoyl transferase component Bud32
MGMTDRFAPGWRIGDYTIERDLGESYEAKHVLLPRRVKLDVMHPQFAGLPPVAVRMMREACLLEAMRHPGVPRVFEVGVIADGRTNRPWVASELVEGEVARGPLAPADVLALVRDVADVMAHAHERGIVHRRLRLDAIVCGDGTRGFPLCVVDWNDARADAGYDARADDVRALGLLALHALTGTPQISAPRPARELAPGAPSRLCMMIDDLLLADPINRPSAAESRARAKLIADTIHEDDEPIVEERVVLVDISRGVPPPIPRRDSRWTPSVGVRITPAEPMSDPHGIGILKTHI